jgi:sulfide dehydrogenase [flavocytochrome c] flavoprotein subunit
LNGKWQLLSTTHREDNKRKEITAKRYEEWAKGLWRELLG